MEEKCYDYNNRQSERHNAQLLRLYLRYKTSFHFNAE